MPNPGRKIDIIAKLVKEIDQKWNHETKTSDLVLVFKIGGKAYSSYYPHILEMSPPPRSERDANSHSFFDPDPVTYLDCSGLQFCTHSTADEVANTFASILILSRFLQQAKYVKVLIITTTALFNSDQWKSSILSCPAVHIVNQLGRYEHNSVGMVVIMQKKRSTAQKNPTPQSRSEVQELRRTFLEQMSKARNDLQLTTETEQQSQSDLQVNFLNAMIRTEKFLIIEQDRFWDDGSIQRLVYLPSPPGYKIVRFCQQKIQVSRQITKELFWQAVHDSSTEGRFLNVANGLENRYRTIIIERGSYLLYIISCHYLAELQARPRRKDHSKVAVTIRNTMDLCMHDCTVSDYYSRLMELATCMEFPVDIETDENLKRLHEQLQLLSDVFTELLCGLQRNQSKFSNKLEQFHGRLERKIVPILSKRLKKEREDICTILQCLYISLSEDLIKVYNDRISLHFSTENSRSKAIDGLTKDVEQLDLLMCETTSTSLISIYKRLTPVTEQELMETLEIKESGVLEDKHNILDDSIEKLGQEYISCKNHSAAIPSRKLKNHLEKMKVKLISCNGLVLELREEIKSFVQMITKSFSESTLDANLNQDTIEEKLKYISSLLSAFEIRQNSVWGSITDESPIILTDELEYISKLLLDQSISRATKLSAQATYKQLQSFIQLQQPNQKISNLLPECLSPLSEIPEQLDVWRSCLSLVVFLMEYISTYEYQRKYEDVNLAIDPIKTDPDFFQLLSRVLPRTRDTNLHTFQCHAWKELKSVTKLLVNFSTERNIKLQSGSVLMVTGNYLKFSDFCSREELNRDELKEIRILAREIIFIDVDLHDRKGRELQVYLIAPRMEVMGSRTVTLDGIDGRNLNSWTDGHVNKGRNGLPGRPGGNGGHFYLVCETMKNAPLLRVNCRGGNGGNALNGSNGRPGNSGRSAHIGDLPGGEGVANGQLGTAGGNGGDGGKGGHPGYGGSVILSYESQDGAVKVSRKDGERGNDGRGGRGGPGGNNGNGFRREKRTLWFGYTEDCIPCRTAASGGEPGANGKNTNGQLMPKPQKLMPDSVEAVVSDFRYLAMTPAFNTTAVKQLMAKIDASQEISRLSPQLLANDLLKLEGGHNIIDHIISEHESFQARLKRFEDWKMENGGVDQETKHVLSLLYAFSISKVLVLKEHQNEKSALGMQVISLLEYFDVIHETVKRLESSHVECDRREALQNYHLHLQRKCEDTERFISKAVLPAVQNAEKEIQTEIGNCLEEVNDYENLVEEDLRMRQEAYYDYIHRVQTLETYRGVLTTVHTTCEIALLLSKFIPSLCGPANVTKVMTGTLIGVLNQQIPEVPPTKPVLELPACLNVSIDFLLEINKTKQGMIKQVELVSGFLEAHDELESIFSPLLNKWRAHIEKLQTSQQSNFLDVQLEFAEIEKCRTETLNVITQCKESTNISPETRTELGRLIVQITICHCNPNLESSNIDSHVAANDINRVTDPRLEKIKKHKMAIYQMLIPVVKMITGELSSTKNEQINAAACQKWQMHTTLRHLKEKVVEFVKELKSEKRLLESIQKFEEAMSLIFDLYDILEKYEESKIFSDTLHALTTQRIDSAGIVSNPEVKKSVSKINFLLRANVFLLDYNEALKTFKQWVFPFASKYLPTMHVTPVDPKGILIEGDDEDDYKECLKNLVAQFVGKFENIRGHLARYKAMTMDFDSVLVTGKFSSASKTSPPFFIWKWEDWGDVIDKLLNGEEVQLRSDIRVASTIDGGRRGAVKFKTVQLLLKHKKGFNSKEQKELSKILKQHYKVTMTHSGMSYYRVFSQYFVMRGNRQEFCYSVDSSTRNVTYEKCSSSGDYLLSPYTLWSFKLSNVGEGGSANALNKFRGLVNLELEGDGWFLDEKDAREKRLHENYLNDLHNHYELVDIDSDH